MHQHVIILQEKVDGMNHVWCHEWHRTHGSHSCQPFIRRIYIYFLYLIFFVYACTAELKDIFEPTWTLSTEYIPWNQAVNHSLNDWEEKNYPTHKIIMVLVHGTGTRAQTTSQQYHKSCTFPYSSCRIPDKRNKTVHGTPLGERQSHSVPSLFRCTQAPHKRNNFIGDHQITPELCYPKLTLLDPPWP